MNCIFFGSTDDSVTVLMALPKKILTVVAVVTQQPKPIGRKQILTPTPVEQWAKKEDVPVLSFTNNEEKPWLYKNEEDVVNTLMTFHPDILVSACYGQKIPTETIQKTKFGGLNIHPSLLPRWRGADPIPWTILSGDSQTGVTIVTLSETFDEGLIIAKEKIPLTNDIMPDVLRSNLFSLGGTLLSQIIPDYCSGKLNGTPQKKDDAVYARKLTRPDGYIPWELIENGIKGTLTIEQLQQETLYGDVWKKEPQYADKLSPAALIERMIRALSPWPGVWTLLRPSPPAGGSGLRKGRPEKRLKILEAHEDHGKLVLDTVQMEGKTPVAYSTIA